MKIKEESLMELELILDENEQDLLSEITAVLHYKDFNWAWKRWVETSSELPLYHERDGKILIFKGWTSTLMYKFEQYLDESSKELLRKLLYSRFSEDFNGFSELRNEQNDWVKGLLSTRRAICQTPTGRGKTEVIGRLTKYFLDKGENVLIMASSSGVIQEIALRLQKFDPDLVVDWYWDSDAQINIINPKGFCRSSCFDENDPFLNKVSVVLTDEVDKAVSESCYMIFDNIKNPECHYYGFSATAEKVKAAKLDPRDSLDCIKTETSKWIIDNFGVSEVFSKPTGYDITLTEYVHKPLREINEKLTDDIFSSSAVYRNVTNVIFSHEEYLNAIGNVLKRVRSLFIPINDLEYLDRVIDRFQDQYHIVTFSSSGFWSSEEGDIDLERFKFLAEENRVKLFMATASGFAGIDFRGITNVLMTLGTQAGTVLQYIGRVARSNKFSICYISPGGNWKLPIYTKHCVTQLELIYDYYSECKIKFEEINISNG